MAELNIIEKVIALEAVDLLKNLTPDQLARIAAIAKETSLAPSKVVFEPGQTQDALYVVLDGAVDIFRDGQLLHTARQNEVIGAWSLFDPEPVSLAACGSSEGARLLKVNREDFYDLLSDNMEITASIFSTLVKRFRQLVEQ
ncbi:MAG: cyclic nucleotide-binding domain-containing protein [Acidobacteria bacterium]|nr:cyclic nucleotide-binding domain-containing protein [Acidobacteriota bacterium]